jgi:predicted nucleotidyltransferase
MRRKDAADLAYLASNYENIPGLMKQLYDQHEAVLETYEWDTKLSGAHVLGLKVAQIASASTLAFLKDLLGEDQIANLERDADFGTGNETGEILGAFFEGLLSP